MAYMKDSTGRRLDSFPVAPLDSSDVGYDIIPILGQSNGLGRGLGFDPLMDTQDSRVRQFGNLASPLYADRVVVASDPLLHQELPAETVGFALTFARMYASIIPQNRRVLLVPCAHGNTGFFDTGPYTWIVGAAGADVNLYTLAIQQITKALGLPGGNHRVSAVLWHQGEANIATDPTTYAGYQDALFSDLRTRYGNIPIVLGGQTPRFLAASAGARAIDTAQRATISRLPKIGFWAGVDLDNSTGDLVHYSAQGQRANGHQAFAAYLLARSNSGGIVLAPPVVETVLAEDQFNRTNAATLGSATTGQPWTIFGAAVANGTIVSNQVVAPATGTANAHEGLNVGQADYELTVKLVAAGTRQTGIFFRTVDTLNGWRVACRASAGDFHYILQSVIAGTVTTVETSTILSADGDNLEIKCIGNTIAISVNGSQAFSHVLTASANRTGTRVGFWWGAISSGSVWDAFKVTRKDVRI